jgi:hypothetical protein
MNICVIAHAYVRVWFQLQYCNLKLATHLHLAGRTASYLSGYLSLDHDIGIPVSLSSSLMGNVDGALVIEDHTPPPQSNMHNVGPSGQELSNLSGICPSSTGNVSTIQGVSSSFNFCIVWLCKVFLLDSISE